MSEEGPLSASVATAASVPAFPAIPATASTATGLPRKRFYRQRAHANPLSDHHMNVPLTPAHMDWSLHYPAHFLPPLPASAAANNGVTGLTAAAAATAAATAAAGSGGGSSSGLKVTFVDVGCGYGGLLVALAPLFPTELMLGMEIRVKVADYVQDRVAALRIKEPGVYDNISVIRTNAMKFMPNFFSRGQLKKLFFLYPDPHFKKKKHKWRIINETLLAEYAYTLQIGGLVYTITDVVDMHLWMTERLAAHPLFERVSEHELKEDKVVPLLYASTEEGKKVYRNKAAGQNHGDGDIRLSVFRRVSGP